MGTGETSEGWDKRYKNNERKPPYKNRLINNNDASCVE
jgi:hypothetical protein